MHLASGLSVRVRVIENSIALLRAMSDRLRYLQPSTGRLIAMMAQNGQFASLHYLQTCHREMERGRPFSESWTDAVHGEASRLGREEAEILAAPGGILGRADLESQLSELEHACILLENRLEYARGTRDRHARMYRSLGVLCGLAVAIVLL